MINAKRDALQREMAVGERRREGARELEARRAELENAHTAKAEQAQVLQVVVKLVMVH